MEIAADTIIASRYRVLKELGRGAMGVVYLVEHAHTGDQLALKLLIGHAGCNPDAVARFKREARASARIKSENVVKVVDADVAPELGGAPFLVMELLNGSDLEKHLAQRGRLSFEEVVTYLGQAGRALDRSHAAGIVHRDLKPENIFLHHREDGAVVIKVVDFGISKIMQDPNVPDSGLAGAGMTQTGAVMGTPLYMAPEQARGKTSLIGPGTDVWAIGLIAVHLLVGQGQIYWRAVNIGELMVQIIAEPLYPPSSRWAFLPPSFDAWFMRSLARDPNERFKSVGEQVAHLAAALGLPHLAPGLASSGGSASNPQAPQAPASTPMLTTQPSPLGAATGTGSALARSVSGVGMQAGKRSPVMAFVALGVVTLAVVATASWFGVGYFKSHRSAAASSIDAPRATDSAPSTATIPSAAIAMPAASSAPSVASTPSAASVATASVAAAHTSKVPPPATHASATTAHTAVTATTSTKPPAGKKGQDFDAP